MHLHGHNAYILQEGPCAGTPAADPVSSAPYSLPTNSTSKRDSNVDQAAQQKRAAGACWDGSIVNPDNPQRRDVQFLAENSYIVIQYDQDNPGVWPLHCHIAWHLSAGMSWQVIEQPDLIKNDMDIPSVMAQTCRDWAAWTGEHVVDQIDDGI